MHRHNDLRDRYVIVVSRRSTNMYILYIFIFLISFRYLDIWCREDWSDPATLYWSICTKKLKWAVMYLCVSGIDLSLSTTFLLNFGIVPTALYFCFLSIFIFWVFVRVQVTMLLLFLLCFYLVLSLYLNGLLTKLLLFTYNSTFVSII